MKYLFFVVLSISILDVHVLNAAQSDLTMDEQEIAEAVFRFQFANNGSYFQNKARLYCLSINGNSPEDSFFERFTDLQTPVVGIDKCPPIRENFALILNISKIVRKTTTKAHVHGGFYINNVNSSDNKYFLKKRKGKWKVVKKRLLSIS